MKVRFVVVGVSAVAVAAGAALRHRTIIVAIVRMHTSTTDALFQCCFSARCSLNVCSLNCSHEPPSSIDPLFESFDG